MSREETMELLSMIGLPAAESLRATPAMRLAVAKEALRLGLSIDEVAECLTWSDFELFVADVLASCYYEVKKGIRLRCPRVQIDVVGIKGDLLLALDCKHWSKGIEGGGMRRIVREQVKRCEALARAPPFRAKAKEIVPCIVTLREERLVLIEGTPIVPVLKLSDFALSVEGYKEGLKRLRIDLTQSGMGGD